MRLHTFCKSLLCFLSIDSLNKIIFLLYHPDFMTPNVTSSLQKWWWNMCCFIRFPSSRAGNWNVCVVILLSGKIERFCICTSLGTDSDWQRWRWTFKEIGPRCCDVILLTAYSMIHYCHYCHFHSVPPYADPPDQWMFYLVDNESYGSINDDPELSMKWLQ